MKKKFLIVIFGLFCNFLFSQTNIVESVSPKNFYVGDFVELSYSFKSGIDFFSDLEKDVFLRELKISSLSKEWQNQDFTVKRLYLKRENTTYSLIIDFVPWKTGVLIFPEIDLFSLIFEKSSVPFVIKLSPVEVSSILAQNVELKPLIGPKLIPGTIYFVWVVIIVFLVVVFFVLSVLFRWKKVSQKVKDFKLRLLYSKNAKKSLKLILKLQKKRLQDSDFAQNLQKILKDYISVRFGRNFLSCETSKIFSEFENIFQGTMSDFYQEQIESLISVFYRTDYIRFAQNSIDSARLPHEKFSANFLPDEKSNICKNCIDFIKNIEKGSF